MAGEKSNYLSAGFLALIFNGTSIANLAQNGTSPLTQLWVSLHTADPGAGGSQTTNEVAYTGYARVAVARTGVGWVLTGETINPAGTITFPTGTGGSGTATFFGIGTNSSGAGNLLYAGPLTPSIVCGNGVTPTLTSATSVNEA